MEVFAGSTVTEMETTKLKKPVLPSDIGTDPNFKREIVWKNVFAFTVLHAGAAYGFYLLFFECQWLTAVDFIAGFYILGMGVTAGAHRLWSHKSYKARLPLKLFLLAMQTATGQNCLYIWVRDHRQHHKYSDTDADPHNSNRGFFFSHMGWLMCKKHPMVKEKGKGIDVSDLEADPWVMFQMKYYNILYVLLAVVLPVSIPVLFYGESVWNAFFISYLLRYTGILHVTWTVNSVAHFYGNRPYDRNLVAVETLFVAFWSAGEGWHNYHHAFPWDYKAAEFGADLNYTLFFLDLMAYFGLAYDLREASPEMVRKRAIRTGDGSHKSFGHMSINNNNNNEPISEKKYAEMELKSASKLVINKTG